MFIKIKEILEVKQPKVADLVTANCKLNTAYQGNGGLAQLARALALHARGHRFDSDILHEQSTDVDWKVH